MSIGLKIVYSNDHWRLFEQLRRETLEMMIPLNRMHILCYAYGSIARGDVKETSDVDIFIPNPPSPSFIESILLRNDKIPSRREIIQATPSYAVKGYIYLDNLRSYSFPLVTLTGVEKDFIRFAGEASYNQIKKGKRILGVDKRLFLIEPAIEGHVEYSIEGREGMIAKMLDVDIHIVLQRVRTLRRRKIMGRTGVYMKHALAADESFGEALKGLARTRPALRRRIRK